MTAEHGLSGVLPAGRRWGWPVAVTFTASNVLLALGNPHGVQHMSLVSVGAILMSAAIVGLVVAQGDPLRLAWAIPIATTNPVVFALVLWQLPVPVHSIEQLWPLSAAVCLNVFLCIRGATFWAWASMLVAAAVCVHWAAATGQGVVYGGAVVAIDFASLLMATAFALAIRPVAQAVVRMRKQTQVRAAEEAATIAVLRERDSQLDRLDRVARPLLDVIAGGRLLTVGEQDECRLLEAELRDQLRAGIIIDPLVAKSAHDARERGIVVHLLDDGAMKASPTEVISILRTEVRAVLERAERGTVVVRVQPPGRKLVATVLITDDDCSVRIEIDRFGTVRTSGDEARL